MNRKKTAKMLKTYIEKKEKLIRRKELYKQIARIDKEKKQMKAKASSIPPKRVHENINRILDDISTDCSNDSCSEEILVFNDNKERDYHLDLKNRNNPRIEDFPHHTIQIKRINDSMVDSFEAQNANDSPHIFAESKKLNDLSPNFVKVENRIENCKDKTSQGSISDIKTIDNKVSTSQSLDAKGYIETGDSLSQTVIFSSVNESPHEAHQRDFDVNHRTHNIEDTSGVLEELTFESKDNVDRHNSKYSNKNLIESHHQIQELNLQIIEEFDDTSKSIGFNEIASNNLIRNKDSTLSNTTNTYKTFGTETGTQPVPEIAVTSRLRTISPPRSSQKNIKTDLNCISDNSNVFENHQATFQNYAKALNPKYQQKPNDKNLNCDKNDSSKIINESLSNHQTKNAHISFKRPDYIEKCRKSLPIYYHEADIIHLIHNNIITYIQGNTGTGKTTQIPQFILENGLTRGGKLAIALPRRLLAKMLSKRLNYETNTKISGYKIKYENTCCDLTLIEAMTEGVLLREIQQDFLLTKYNIIILDEVHERSCNVDILIGILSRIVKHRSESQHPLRLVLMSACNILEDIQKIFELKVAIYDIKSDLFKVYTRFEKNSEKDYITAAFNKIHQILDSSILFLNNEDNQGRQYKEGAHYSKYKKEINPQKINDIKILSEKNNTKQKRLCFKQLNKSRRIHASKEIKFDSAEHNSSKLNLPKDIKNDPSSGILCFLPSKDDIYKLKNMLEHDKKHKLTILPLHSALSTKNQALIFRESKYRKVILATNIAESSLTIPGITFVIDTGRSKFKRYLGQNCYSYEIDFISKQNAIQRGGRCGRTENGVCFRLYSSEMFEAFDSFITPAITTENLDSTLLFMKKLGIPDVYKFPYITRPNDLTITESLFSLQHIRALKDDFEITHLGKLISMFPIEPIFATLFLKESKNTQELIGIASILSVELEITQISRFTNAFVKSDIIAKLLIFFKFIESEIKDDFCHENGLIFNQFDEAFKLFCQLKNLYLKIFANKESIFERKIQSNLSKETQNMLIQSISKCFSKNIAERFGQEFYFKDEMVKISKNSIYIGEAKKVVFSHMVKGSRSIFLKDITILED